MRFKAYQLVEDAVNKGISYGYSRAHKHTDIPSEDHIFQQIESAIMSELSDIIDWDRDLE